MKYSWEINGTRRPFPSLWRAAELYGNRIYYKKPVYVGDRCCPWCGKEVTNKRRVYCSDDCKNEFNNMTVWHRGRDAYSLRILYRDNFTCQETGEFHAFKNAHGVYVPIDDGRLHVHHIVPVYLGGGDEPENLITLSVEQHKMKHKRGG